MSQTVYRVAKNRDNPYVMINKSVFDDDRLSWRAKGLMGYLLSKPDDWKIVESDLVNRAREGRDAVRVAIRELIALGYIVRTQTRTDGKFGSTEYHVYESPVDPNGAPEGDGTPSTENPVTVTPQTGNPSPETPSTEKPSTENPTLLNNDLTKYSRSPNNDPTKRTRKNVTTSKRPNDYDPRYHTFYVQTEGQRYAAYMDANPDYVDAVRKFWPDAV